MQTAAMPPAIVDAEGCELILADGTRLVDGIASWWTMAHGYKHPHLVEAVQKQAERLSHVMFGGLAHEPAYTLAERLVAFTPQGLERVFFADSGSIAVEIALKMALQYWRNLGSPRKGQFLCFRNGYHGDTLGAMSVSDADSEYAQAFSHVLTHHFMVDIPHEEYDFSELESLLKDHHKDIAGCIIEPLVQGAGGIKLHAADTLAEIHRICKKYDVLLIADEIAVGFYRSGYRFACDEAGITPDIMTIGKALTGGMVSMAATLATEEVFDAFLSDSFDTALMHGPTYMANPLACAAAHASLDLFEGSNYQHKVEAIEQQLRAELGQCQALKGVHSLRIKGAIAAIELHPEAVDILWYRQKFVELGVWVRPIGNVIYLMPPLVINQAQLAQLTTAIYTAIEAYPKR